jgi:hypothetical protein
LGFLHGLVGVVQIGTMGVRGESNGSEPEACCKLQVQGLGKGGSDSFNKMAGLNFTLKPG